MTFPQNPEPPAQPPATQQYAPPQQQPAAPRRPNGLALTALIVGIVAFLLGLVPVLGIILGLVGLGFGIFALVKKQPKGLALTGTILAGCAIIASIATTAGMNAMFSSLPETTTKAAEEIKAPAPEDADEPAEEAAPEPTEEPEPEAEPEAEPKERLTLDEGWEVGTDDFGVSTIVRGYVSNNSDKAVTNYIQITFDTLDAAGANLGTCIANTNTIDANGKWKFEAYCFDTTGDIADVRFKEITGF
ncbi:FxLYD domain-containing protein [Leucobacter sp.]